MWKLSFLLYQTSTVILSIRQVLVFRLLLLLLKYSDKQINIRIPFKKRKNECNEKLQNENKILQFYINLLQRYNIFNQLNVSR